MFHTTVVLQTVPVLVTFSQAVTFVGLWIGLFWVFVDWFVLGVCGLVCFGGLWIGLFWGAVDWFVLGAVDWFVLAWSGCL